MYPPPKCASHGTLHKITDLYLNTGNQTTSPLNSTFYFKKRTPAHCIWYKLYMFMDAKTFPKKTTKTNVKSKGND